MERTLPRFGLSSLLAAACVAAACSASGVDDQALAPSSGGGGESAGGSGTTGGASDGGGAGTSTSTGGGGSAGTSGASGGAAGTAGAMGGASGAGAGGGPSGGAGPSTNPMCQPGVAPGAPQTAPVVVLGSGAMPGADGQFGGADDPSIAPTIVYPDDQTIVPPNLNTLEIHLQPGGSSTLFEIRFANQAIDFRFYSSCTATNGGCIVGIDPGSWMQLATAAKGSGPLALTVRGVDPSNPAKVGTSAARTFEIAPDPVLGGLYYWNAGDSKIVRYDFGNPAGVAENYYTMAEAGSICVGCHALSPKGSKMAAGLNAPIMPVPLKVIDVATKKTLWSLPDATEAGSSYEAFSPDETEIITSIGGAGLTLRDAATGAPKDPKIPQSSGPMTMPDFVPDGSGIVYVTGPCSFGACNLAVQSGSIAFLPRSPSGWGAEQILVPSGMDNYYPSVSPDSKWVLFNHSTVNLSSDEAPDASLWVVPLGSGSQPTPVQLARANGTAPNVSSSWPKFSPFVGCGGEIMWFTFSSNRDYGLRIQNAGKDPKAQTWQLWMGAFNHAKAAQGQDPSFAAFWLPFQDPTTGNHIAQWVQAVKRTPCTQDSDCTSTTTVGTPLTCNAGFCAPK